MMTVLCVMLLTLLGCVVMVCVLVTAAWVMAFIGTWRASGAAKAPTAINATAMSAEAMREMFEKEHTGIKHAVSIPSRPS